MSLPSHSQYVVIGGGIVGCSSAYHLARDHSADVLLLEQGQLTGGSTWHAAGLVGQLRASAAVTELLRYSVDLYGRLADETGLDTGWKMTGCLRLAMTRDRWLEYQRLATTARSFGMDMHLLSPSEVAGLWPLMQVEDLVGASWLPTDGQVNPTDVTQSLARGARQHGARIVENTSVTGFSHRAGRIHAVHTSAGTVNCENVLLCAGLWSRTLAARLGVVVPVQAVKHQYVVTEHIPDLDSNAPTVRDPDRRTYFKEEVGGLVLGGYEPNPIPWEPDTIPDDFQFHLFDDNWSHFEQHLGEAIARIPVLQQIGVKQMINGAESFTPDGNFILGAAPGVDNLFVGTGFNAFGIAAGGGAGWVLAQWAADKAAPSDLWSVDLQRFSSLPAETNWVRARTLEAYGKHYAVAYPHSEFQSARHAIVSPLYDRLAKRGAVFGSKSGWERANWFASADETPEDQESMGKPNWFAAVAREHHAVRNSVGLIDQSSFAKFELRGVDACAVLQQLTPRQIGNRPGRISYSQFLNDKGGIECDLTVAQLSDNHFYLVTGTGFRTHDGNWIRSHIPGNARVDFDDVTESWGTLSLMGPYARHVLAAVTADDVSNQAFPFANAQLIKIAGHAVRALRISYVGELGWELHMPTNAVAKVFDALLHAGQPYELRLIGYRAIESLRLEKAYRAWGADIGASDDLFAAGLDAHLRLDANHEFVGRDALLQLASAPRVRRLVGFSVTNRSATLLGRETVLRNGEAVGYLRSAGYGHTADRPIGYGYVTHASGVTDAYLQSGNFELVVATESVPASVHTEALYDPSGSKLRS